MRPRAEIMAEIAELQRLANKRRGKPGFSANVEMIEERIAEAQAELEESDGE